MSGAAHKVSFVLGSGLSVKEERASKTGGEWKRVLPGANTAVIGEVQPHQLVKFMPRVEEQLARFDPPVSCGRAYAHASRGLLHAAGIGYGRQGAIRVPGSSRGRGGLVPRRGLRR